MRRALGVVALSLWGLVITASVCAAQVSDVFRDPRMDFGSIQTVAVMPFTNLARDQVVSERVRDVFISRLLATQAVYVLPVGEVARGISATGVQNPSSPTPEEVIKIGALLQVDAVVTGVVREYGEVRSGTATANVISVSMQMIEIQTRKVVWTASTTKGGINTLDRLFGGGGRPMNDVTQAAIDDLLNKLLY